MFDNRDCARHDAGMKPDWKLIDRLAVAIGIGAPAIAQWRVRGVPRMYHMLLLDEARARNIRATREQLGIPPENDGKDRPK